MSRGGERGRPKWIWPAAIAAIALLAYLDTLDHSFTLDDVPLVQADTRLDAGNVLQRVWVEPYWPNNPEAGLYRPVTTLSFATDRALSGTDPGGYHRTNLLLHALASVLVWFLVRDLGTPYGTPILAAALFAVHPLHTEAVAGIVGRAEILAAIGTLAAWWAHRAARRGRWVGAVAAPIAFLLATLSKESALLAPLVFLVDDRLDRGAPRSPAVRWLSYGAAAGVALALRTVALGGLARPTATIELDNPLAFVGVVPRVLTALWTQVRYLGLTLWPHPLSSDYSQDAIPPVEGLGDARAWAGLAALGAGLALFFWAWRRGSRLALVAAVWAAGMLPASNLVFAAGTIFAERLTYWPSVATCGLVGWALAAFAGRDGPGGPNRQRARVVAVAVTAVALLLASLIVTRARNPAWADNPTLASTDVLTQPRAARLQAGLGLSLYGEGRLDEAEAAFRRAVELSPTYAQSHYNLGRLLAHRGARAEALEHLQRAAELAPGAPHVFAALAPLLQSAGRPDDAAEAYRRAVTLAPAPPERRMTAARALVAVGRNDDARRLLASVAADTPDTLTGRFAAALEAELAGEPERAAAIYDEMLARPDLPAASRTEIERRRHAVKSPSGID